MAPEGDPASPDHRTVTLRWLQLIGSLIVIAGLAAFVAAHRSEVPAAWHAVRDARPGYLLIAAAAVLAWLVNLAMFHAAAQRLAGATTRPRHLLLPAATANALNLVVKGNMAGLVPLIGEGRRRRVSRSLVLVAYLVVIVVGEWAFAATLAVALVAMVRDGVLTRAEVLAAVAFGVLLAAKAVVVVAAARSAQSLERVYLLPRRLWAWIRRRPPTAHDRQAVDEMVTAVEAIRADPRRLLPCAVHALAVEAIGILELWAVLRALGVGSLTTALVAYTIGVLFSIIGFLPGGLGFVEVSVGAALTAFGVPGATAAAAVVLYRICELWLPLAAGGAASLVVRRSRA